VATEPKTFTYDHPRPALTVDLVVFGVETDKQTGDLSLRVLLIERGQKPYKGRWALPGGFVELGEDLEKAAFRELWEETGILPSHIEQLYTFGAPKRDPRERVVSVAYLALIPMNVMPLAGSDAKKAQWHPVETTGLLSLAFDHDEILNKALERLRQKIRYAPIGFGLMPEVFTIGELQRLYELVSGQAFDKSNFRKKIFSLGVLTEAGKRNKTTQLYMFDKESYFMAVKQGISFEI